MNDVEPKVTADTLIQQTEKVQEVIIQEQIIGQAKAEEQQATEQADIYSRQLGDKFCSTVVSLGFSDMLEFQVQHVRAVLNLWKKFFGNIKYFKRKILQFYETIVYCNLSICLCINMDRWLCVCVCTVHASIQLF